MSLPRAVVSLLTALSLLAGGFLYAGEVLSPEPEPEPDTVLTTALGPDPHAFATAITGSAAWAQAVLDAQRAREAAKAEAIRRALVAKAEARAARAREQARAAVKPSLPPPSPPPPPAPATGEGPWGPRTPANCGGWRPLVAEYFPNEITRACRVLWCESSGNPNATNGKYRGLFQIAHGSYDPRTNVRHASEMAYTTRGGWGHWECK